MRRAWRPEWIDDEEITQEFYDAQAAVYMPQLPPINGADAYIVGYLMEIGPTAATGMGATPLPFGEIDAWRRLTGINLAPEDWRLIRQLSAVYLSESTKATENFCQPPWWPEDEPRPMTREEAEAERQKRM